MIYVLSIDAVDGETFYSMEGSNKKSLFSFLERYDHEGSSISLAIKEEGKLAKHIFNSEEVYNFLMKNEEKI